MVDSDAKIDKYLNDRFRKYPSFDNYSGVVFSGPNTIGLGGDTPIFIACMEGDMEAVSTLINYGANVNFVGDRGTTPIQTAVRGENVDIVLLLLKKGADPNHKSDFGLSSIDIAQHKFDRGGKMLKALSIDNKG